MRYLLERIYIAVEKANGQLTSRSQAAFRKQYQESLAEEKKGSSGNRVGDNDPQWSINLCFWGESRIFM
jgi:hypothetical protein